MTQQIEVIPPGEFIAYRIEMLKQVLGTRITHLICGLDTDLTGLTAQLPVTRSEKFANGLVNIHYCRTYAKPPELNDQAGAKLNRSGLFFVFDHVMEFVV